MQELLRWELQARYPPPIHSFGGRQCDFEEAWEHLLGLTELTETVPFLMGRNLGLTGCSSAATAVSRVAYTQKRT